MATGKRYYWIKLKDSFMSSDMIDYLMGQPDGANYVVLYQMLCLKTINTGGRLAFQIGDMIIPYDVEKIQRECKWFSLATVRVALEVYKQIGLIYEDKDGVLVLANYSDIVGSETDYSAQKRLQRENRRRQLPPKCADSNEDNNVDNVHTEKEIEIEKEREGETGHPAPAAYGRYNNVILTDTELSGLKTELPDKWEYYIDRLSCHIASTGKQYQSHAATIYKWAQEDAAKGKAAPKQGIPDYSCKEGESL
mgnify:CR=1 FL=1